MLGSVIAAAVGIGCGFLTNWLFGQRASGWIWFALCTFAFVISGSPWIFLLALAYGRLQVVAHYPAR